MTDYTHNAEWMENGWVGSQYRGRLNNQQERVTYDNYYCISSVRDMFAWLVHIPEHVMWSKHLYVFA